MPVYEPYPATATSGPSRLNSFQEFVNKAEIYNSPVPRVSTKIDGIDSTEVKGKPSNQWAWQNAYQVDLKK